MSMSSYSEILQARSRLSRLCLPIAQSSEREVTELTMLTIASLPSAQSSERAVFRAVYVFL